MKDFKKKRKIALAWIIISAVIFVSASIVLIVLEKANFLPIPFIIFAITECIASQALVEVTSKYKEKYIKNLVNQEGFEFYFSKTFLNDEFNLPLNEFLKTNFPCKRAKKDNYELNDYIKGIKNDILCRSIDVFYYNENDDTKESLFRGRVYAFDLKLDKSFLLVGKKDNSIIDNLDVIEFESIALNDNFTFFTNDMHMAYYYFSPNIIQNILVLDNKTKCRFSIAIADGSLYIGVNKIDSFKLTNKTNELAIKRLVQEEFDFINLCLELFGRL